MSVGCDVLVRRTSHIAAECAALFVLDSLSWALHDVSNPILVRWVSYPCWRFLDATLYNNTLKTSLIAGSNSHVVSLSLLRDRLNCYPNGV